MKQTIAIVEDEPALAAGYAELLDKHSFRSVIYRDQQAALEGLDLNTPDLLLLDVGLGDDAEAGFDVCRHVRSRHPLLPIIFLTARDTEIDIISGLRLGADDYLTKDISHSHLLARISALLRRMAALQQPEHQGQVLKRDKLEMNAERLTTLWQGQPIALTYTEFWMLHALVKHPGHIKSRQQLMDAASVVLDDSTITSHVRRIRRKFEQADPGFDLIETAYGLGYRWHTTA